VGCPNQLGRTQAGIRTGLSKTAELPTLSLVFLFFFSDSLPQLNKHMIIKDIDGNVISTHNYYVLTREWVAMADFVAVQPVEPESSQITINMDGVRFLQSGYTNLMTGEDFKCSDETIRAGMRYGTFEITIPDYQELTIMIVHPHVIPTISFSSPKNSYR
jgi:hypothetical protein